MGNKQNNKLCLIIKAKNIQSTSWAHFYFATFFNSEAVKQEQLPKTLGFSVVDIIKSVPDISWKP